MSRFGAGFTSALSGGNDTFTKALLHMEGANGGTVFTDSNIGGSAHTWTSGGAVTSNFTPKFGATCMGGAWIDTPAHSDFNIGAGDFAVDCWINTNAFGLGTLRYFAGQADSSLSGSNTSWYLLLTTGNVVGAVIQSTTPGTFAQLVSTTTHTINVWKHVALVKSGTSYKLYIDGVQEASTTMALPVLGATSKLAIGRAGELAGSTYPTALDEFRLSVGMARWTANFTPPISAYI